MRRFRNFPKVSLRLRFPDFDRRQDLLGRMIPVREGLVWTLCSTGNGVTLSSRRLAPGGAAVMDVISSPDILLFGPFRFDRRGGFLFRRSEDGCYLPVSIGSRALAVLGVLTQRTGE